MSTARNCACAVVARLINKAFYIKIRPSNFHAGTCIMRAGRFLPMLAMSMLCPVAQAEESVSAEQNLIQIPIDQLVNMEVDSASKIARQVSDAPSAVSIVTAEDIKSYGYHSLAEILESMRGLYVTSDRAYSFLGGRGFGRPGDFTGRIMLLVDGNQVNNNIYNSAGLGTTGLIDVSLIERVEYVSGPGSTVYGNNAFYGIINVVTKPGHYINGLQVTGEVGSYNSRDLKINFGKRFDNGADVLLSASGFRWMILGSAIPPCSTSSVCHWTS